MARWAEVEGNLAVSLDLVQSRQLSQPSLLQGAWRTTSWIIALLRLNGSGTTRPELVPRMSRNGERRSSESFLLPARLAAFGPLAGKPCCCANQRGPFTTRSADVSKAIEDAMEFALQDRETARKKAVLAGKAWLQSEIAAARAKVAFVLIGSRPRGVRVRALRVHGPHLSAAGVSVVWLVQSLCAMHVHMHRQRK